MSETRNPKWEMTELILAFDLYLNHDPGTKRGSVAEQLALSESLRELNVYGLNPLPDNYRNDSSVKSKLDNFVSIDKEDAALGRPHGAQGDQYVWDRFHSDPVGLHQTALAIRDVARRTESFALNVWRQDDDAASYPDGIFMYLLHRHFESPQYIKGVGLGRAGISDRKQCAVCGLNGSMTFGELGREVFEYHLMSPISELCNGESVSKRDYVCVCANCHKILHRTTGEMTFEELVNKVRTERG